MVFGAGNSCRFEVSCSEFTKRKIRELGVIGGIREGVRRVISCR
jgi:putative component of membrane protein insertase Oxa1/YidC/SpoIIIJ protein YidD